jgi:hypothetical protein
MVQQPQPRWIDDDSDRGWQGPRAGLTSTMHGTVLRAGVRQDDPNRIRIAYVYKGEEWESEVLPPGTDPHPKIEELINSVVLPISEVRAYRGDSLIETIPVQLRGSPRAPSP